ncbi:DUF1013 domain-containing protein [Rickettsiales bacterium]|nr:DUF1013 domain-containing protein [Rickettsiales bacterium]
MTLPLLPKATAVWLVENTTLTFEQIAEFCGMHNLEVQGIADGEVASGLSGKDPIASKILTKEELERCESDPKARLKMTVSTQAYIANKKKKKTGRYTPVARRQDKPDAIAWILKHCPDAKDAHITKLIGTTKSTIKSIREKTHWNYSNITAKDPVLLGLCTQLELDNFVKISTPKEEKTESSS